MRVLIISYYYSPANMIGAVRASKISKYLNMLNITTDVMCSKDNKLHFMQSNVKLDETLISDTQNIKKIHIDHSSFYKKASKLFLPISRRILNKRTNTPTESLTKNFSFLMNVKKSVIRLISFFMSTYQDFDYLLLAKKEIKRSIENYDVVISIYGPLASHLAGYYFKKKREIFCG